MSKLSFVILLLITTSLMGSSFAIGKMGLVYVSPLLLVALRFTIAGVLMALIVIILKRRHPVSLKDWFRMFMIGAFQTAGVMGCIFISLQTITAGESSILTFTNPLLVVLFGKLFLQFHYYWYQWFGVVIGFIGVLITLGANVSTEIGTMWAIGSAIFWTCATLLIKKWGHFVDIWVLTAYQMLFGGLLLLVSSFVFENMRLVMNVSSVSIIMWLAIMASVVQFGVWFYLLQKHDPGKVSAFLFLAPFFGVLFGWMLLNEPVKWNVWLGGALIFAGIFCVNWSRREVNKVKTKKAVQ
ncbi:DMT family transporter [Salirhabdus salicampi]|uniref:DMT family transporter n=1 Tax=Salirhabdus salicampi TaxID=476102 RepID=UPI0020C572E8|nr:DMT family transporter [Salirhabdus salicampi]MCP8617701.1 DMT family transporter [Salirhabdus salicampi]